MIKMRLPLESKEALALNEKIFAALYYGALVASLELAKKDGPYESFPGSPTSKGLL
jgi:ribonucleotide reductase alpha subunit